MRGDPWRTGQPQLTSDMMQQLTTDTWERTSHASVGHWIVTSCIGVLDKERYLLNILIFDVLTYKVLCGMAPRYLGPLNRVADVSGRRSLRSSGTNRLVVPPFRLSTVGSRAFSVAAAKIWNALPDSLVAMTSLQTFRRHLKTFLFQRSFW